MRIIVMSDSHGDQRAIESVMLRCSDADMFIHLGDGEGDIDRFIMTHTEYSGRVKQVAGNCDFGSMLPGYLIIPAAGLEFRRVLFRSVPLIMIAISYSMDTLISAATSMRTVCT